MRKKHRTKLSLAALALIAALAAPGLRAEEAKEYDGSALAAYLKGVFLESENDYYNAYQFYLYAAARDTGNTRVLLRLAKAAAQVGDFDRSREYADKLLTSGAYGTEARLILAEVEYRLGNRDRSLAMLEELRTRDNAPHFEVLVFFARIAAEAGKRTEAIAALEEAAALDPSDDSVWYDLGILRAEAGEREAAAEAFERAVEVDPDHAGAHLALARLHAAAGEREEAKREYRETLRVDPLSRNAVKELTDMLYADGEYAAGAELLDPFFRDGRLDEGGELLYARFLYRAGRAEDALAVFGKLLGTMGEQPAILRVMIEMEVERGRFRTAFGYAKRLIAAEPERFDSYAGALILLYAPPSDSTAADETIELSDAEKRTYVDAAVKLVPEDSGENNYLMGAILRKAGDASAAEPFLLRAEKIDPRNEATLLELATVYSRLGRYDDALKRLVPLYNRNSDDASLANFYGYILAEKGESLDLAEKLVAKALEKEPENGYFLDSLGWIRYKQGKTGEALEILLSAAAKATDDAVIWEHIGDAYLRLKDRDKARDAFRKSLEIDPKSESVIDKLENLGDR